MEEICLSYHGTVDELVESITQNSRAQRKDIRVDLSDRGKIKIGFCRLGSGGRWFIADISESGGNIKLTGSYQDIYLFQYKDEINPFLFTVSALIIAYFAILFIPAIIWITFKIGHIYILFLIPVPVLVFLRIEGILSTDNKTDKRFLSFMINDVNCALL